MKNYTYYTNCTVSTAEKIIEMTDNAREITYQTFLRHVSFEHLMEVFGFYAKHPKESGIMICNDYAVSFHKSKYNGKTCYYVCHSAIEYIFIDLSN